MNVPLTPTEMLHVLHLIQAHPLKDAREQSALLSKVQRPILDVLDREEDRANEEAYQAWTHQEERKIQDLRNEYLNMWPRKKAGRRK